MADIARALLEKAFHFEAQECLVKIAGNRKLAYCLLELKT